MQGDEHRQELPEGERVPGHLPPAPSGWHVRRRCHQLARQASNEGRGPGRNPFGAFQSRCAPRCDWYKRDRGLGAQGRGRLPERLAPRRRLPAGLGSATPLPSASSAFRRVRLSRGCPLVAPRRPLAVARGHLLLICAPLPPKKEHFPRNFLVPVQGNSLPKPPRYRSLLVP